MWIFAWLGDPSEIAAVAAFPASDESMYLTGETTHVDGERLGLAHGSGRGMRWLARVNEPPMDRPAATQLGEPPALGLTVAVELPIGRDLVRKLQLGAVRLHVG